MPHFHKPSPFSNWKELGSEIAIIVIGVLIALSAEQAVEAAHWAHKIDQAENALHLELSEDDGPQAYARAAIATCMQDDLDKMRALISSRGDRREFLKLAHAYRPPSRTWDAEAWRSVAASDVGTHMGAERIVRWSTPFRVIPSMNASNLRELDDIDSLRGLPDQPGPLSEAEADRLSLAVERTKTDNVFMSLASTIFLISARAVDADVTEKHKQAILAEARQLYGSCVSAPSYQPFNGPIGQYLTPEQEAALMQYRARPGAALPANW
jgi:hypothetical protein